MRFQVTALVEGSRVETLAIDANDPREARSLAQERGYAVLAVRRRLATLGSVRRRRGFPLQLFSQELRVMLEAGLTLPEALQALVEKETREDLRRTLRRVAEALLEGASFSAALGRQPEAFPALYVATIKAAEKTGDLGEALARYVTYQQQLDAIRRKVVSASVYPMLLLAVGVLVAVFLLAYVVPRFAAVYQDLGRELPWITQLMLGGGRFLDEHAALAALATLVAGAGAGYALSRPGVRAALLRQIWRIPRLGERLRIYDLSRLYRTLAMLLRSGMPIVAAMRNASGLLRPEPRARLALALV